MEISNEHVPSFFKNSSPGSHAFEEIHREHLVGKTDEAAGGPSTNSNIIVAELDSQTEDITSKEGWMKSLALLPNFEAMKMERHFIENPSIMTKFGTVSRALKNKKQGYTLWKEGYVRRVLVKPNIKTSRLVFIVKAKVHESVKNAHNTVYVYLKQYDGEIDFTKCTCKAGQCRCCKHAATLFYTILDFAKMGVKDVPLDLACNQKGQKWNGPFPSSIRTYNVRNV